MGRRTVRTNNPIPLSTAHNLGLGTVADEPAWPAGRQRAKHASMADAELERRYQLATTSGRPAREKRLGAEGPSPGPDGEVREDRDHHHHHHHTTALPAGHKRIAFDSSYAPEAGGAASTTPGPPGVSPCS